MTPDAGGTRQRRAVAAALATADGFRSAQELHAAARAAGSAVGLTTVYRALQALADAGQVDVLRTADGESVYRRCATPAHHHHLVCRQCGRSVEVEGPAVEAWAESVAAEHGFTGVTHTVEVFGRCSPCADSKVDSQSVRCTPIAATKPSVTSRTTRADPVTAGHDK